MLSFVGGGRSSSSVVDQRTCGSCTFCCKVMGIKELAKPPGRWCSHCTPAEGCQIYADRPASCRRFSCLWLLNLTLSDTLKPSHSKVVLALDADGTRLMAHCDPTDPLAWRREPMLSYLKSRARDAWGRGRVIARSQDQAWLVTPEAILPMGDLPSELAFRIDGFGKEVTLTVLEPRDGGLTPVRRTLSTSVRRK